MTTIYRITDKTLAILPKRDVHVRTEIIEMEQEIDHTSAPFQIIKENCIHYGANYEGRKKSVQHHLDFHQKTPIPMAVSKGLYAIPTESPHNYDCSWLFFHGIKDTFLQPDGLPAVRLINERILNIDISLYTLQTQYDRAGMCKVVFEQLDE
ncbi:hypothetical protein J416_02114 [Gracilibacillus halophilus YIM-C55.5]|uniref:Competence protein n=1 Tax=Gracilibacillus halophilus YIM-C55.5 TaxID=1308866 RepID=N4WYL0_9BACI|nr:competence protein ComK [Gracilibacillus halophilus]ENH98121.1 hypothetical protein J416_02114 [Gracilibacillus halophilus YIM-C55.5]